MKLYQITYTVWAEDPDDAKQRSTVEFDCYDLFQFATKVEEKDLAEACKEQLTPINGDFNGIFK